MKIAYEKIIAQDLIDYEYACNALALDFNQRYFKGNADWDWVAGTGSVLMISDFYFGMSDIILALKKEVTIKKLFEWYDYYTEPRKGNGVNFNNWLKGMR